MNLEERSPAVVIPQAGLIPSPGLQNPKTKPERPHGPKRGRFHMVHTEPMFSFSTLNCYMTDLFNRPTTSHTSSSPNPQCRVGKNTALPCQAGGGGGTFLPRQPAETCTAYRVGGGDELSMQWRGWSRDKAALKSSLALFPSQSDAVSGHPMYTVLSFWWSKTAPTHSSLLGSAARRSLILSYPMRINWRSSLIWSSKLLGRRMGFLKYPKWINFMSM